MHSPGADDHNLGSSSLDGESIALSRLTDSPRSSWPHSRSPTALANSPFADGSLDVENRVVEHGTETGKTFLNLCINTGENHKTFGEIDISKFCSDGELFSRIRQTYRRLRGYRAWLFLVQPVTVYFVKVCSSYLKSTNPFLTQSSSPWKIEKVWVFLLRRLRFHHKMSCCQDNTSIAHLQCQHTSSCTT